MSSLFLTNCLLIICALCLAGRSYKQGESSDHTSSMVISLSAAFIACAGAGNILLQDPDQDTQTLKRILDNLAYYAAIPLIASAMVDSAWKYEWSRAAWGRWLLALFALFELCRRSEVGIEYSQIMAALSAGAILISALRLQALACKVAGTLAAATLAISLLVYSPTGLIPDQQDAGFFATGLSIFLILIGATIPKTSRGNA